MHKADVFVYLTNAVTGNNIAEIISEYEQFIRLQLDLDEVSNWYLDQSRTDIVRVTQWDI